MDTWGCNKVTAIVEDRSVVIPLRVHQSFFNPNNISSPGYHHLLVVLSVGETSRLHLKLQDSAGLPDFARRTRLCETARKAMFIGGIIYLNHSIRDKKCKTKQNRNWVEKRTNLRKKNLVLGESKTL